MGIGQLKILIPSGIIDLHNRQEELRVFQIENLENHRTKSQNFVLPIDPKLKKLDIHFETYDLGWLLIHLGLDLYLVDGNLIRNHPIDIDFTSGGNGCRYLYIPFKQIWVDVCLRKDDRIPTIVHELLEKIDMESGTNYNNAHDFASRMEMIVRTDSVRFWKDFWPKVINELTGISFA